MKLAIDLGVFLFTQLCLVVYIIYFKQKNKAILTNIDGPTNLSKKIKNIMNVLIASIIINGLMLFVHNPEHIKYLFYVQIAISLYLIILFITLLSSNYDNGFLIYLFLHIMFIGFTYQSIKSTIQFN
jgi:hypothetical protein